ncbi:zinc finger, CCHC-type containing protein [Tanacetum coccineum]
MFRTDRGGEFNSNEFTRYCKENGIARQLTAPYSPQQNGVVERRNRTIMSTTNCMMKEQLKWPQDFWAEAIGKPRKRALEQKPIELFRSTTQRIFVSRDVKFKEDEKWDWSKYLGENTKTNFRIENLEEANKHHDQENQPNEEDYDFPNNNDDG